MSMMIRSFAGKSLPIKKTFSAPVNVDTILEPGVYLFLQSAVTGSNLPRDVPGELHVSGDKNTTLVQIYYSPSSNQDIRTLHKPWSNDFQAWSGTATTYSPGFFGEPTAPTPTVGSGGTQIATKAYVDSKLP